MHPLSPLATTPAAMTEVSGLLMVLLLLGGAVLMFTLNKPRMDVVGLIMMAALPFTGVITMAETLTGFSDPNIVLIALLFVLGDGLVRTGVARKLGDWINQLASGRETRLLVLVMAATGLLGAVMSSTAIVAIFIPVVMRICRSNRMAPSRLMMPLSMAALISGMMTLIATAPNLVVNGELVRQGNEGFHFFSVTPFGMIILVVGLAYMLVARHWLPDRRSECEQGSGRPSLGDWIERYRLQGTEHRVRVRPDSVLLAAPPEGSELASKGITLLAIERRLAGKNQLLRPLVDRAFMAGDVLLLDNRSTDLDLAALEKRFGVERLPLPGQSGYLADFSQEIGMCEVVIRADSPWVGQTIREMRLSGESGLTAIGLRRGVGIVEDGFLDEIMRAGDTLLVVGFWTDLQRAKPSLPDVVFLDLPREIDDVLPAASKAPHAMVILAFVVLAMVTEVTPNVQAVLIGVLLMGLFGVVDLKSAYGAINWKILVLIVGMLPFSLALQRTGGVELAAEGLLQVVGEESPRLVLAALFLATSLLGLFISNTATAVLMAPVAIAIAAGLNVSPYPLAMAVMLAASAAFMTPVSSPVNTLVVSPGGYRFADFLRIGVPFTLLVLIVAVVTIPWFLPF